MFRSYFKTAWRSLTKNKISSFINISGLSVGMFVAMLNGLWIWDECSFNKYHQHFVVLAGISFLIAAPLAWYFMHEWIQKYEYRTVISWWIFILTGAGALLITLSTVSFQSIRAALTSPAVSLRSE